MENSKPDPRTGASKPELSCDRTLTRKEFIRKVVERAAAAGTLVCGLAIADTFSPERAEGVPLVSGKIPG